MPEAPIVQACRALYTAIDRLDQAAADRLGVARTELRCLNLLEHGPVNAKRVGEALGLTSGGVTALLDRLERKGLVARLRDPDDRRGVLVQGTPELYRQLGPLYRAVADELTRAVGRYSPEHQALAVRHLEDVARACEVALAAV